MTKERFEQLSDVPAETDDARCPLCGRDCSGAENARGYCDACEYAAEAESQDWAAEGERACCWWGPRHVG